jgi:hypothetical protein
MRWSRLHGDMQGMHGTRRAIRSELKAALSKTQAKFLVG